MSKLWLPTAELRYANIADIPAGSLVVAAADSDAAIDLGLAVTGLQGGRYVICLTHWMGGSFKPGELIMSLDQALFYLPPEAFIASVELDGDGVTTDAPSAIEDVCGYLALTADGPRLLATANPTAGATRRTIRAFDPRTWTATTLAGLESPRSHTTSWRLRIRFSEDHVITFLSPRYAVE